MVLMVSVEVTAWVPEMAAGWETEQVGGATPPAGLLLIAQERETVPVNPPAGVIVMVEDAEPPAEMAAIGPPVKVKDGC